MQVKMGFQLGLLRVLVILRMPMVCLFPHFSPLEPCGPTSPVGELGKEPAAAETTTTTAAAGTPPTPTRTRQS